MIRGSGFAQRRGFGVRRREPGPDLWNGRVMCCSRPEPIILAMQAVLDADHSRACDLDEVVFFLSVASGVLVDEEDVDVAFTREVRDGVCDEAPWSKDDGVVVAEVWPTDAGAPVCDGHVALVVFRPFAEVDDPLCVIRPPDVRWEQIPGVAVVGPVAKRDPVLTDVWGLDVVDFVVVVDEQDSALGVCLDRQRAAFLDVGCELLRGGTCSPLRDHSSAGPDPDAGEDTDDAECDGELDHGKRAPRLLNEEHVWPQAHECTSSILYRGQLCHREKHFHLVAV